jgi:predicted metal-dependent phosphoesterase TrpH
MLVDLHVHTYPASDCSQIAYRDLLTFCRLNGVQAIALTNHGDVTDNLALEGPMAEQGVVLVHGVEISTLYGDFILFSPDLDYLATFQDVQGLPRAEEIPDTAAMVWVHPAAGGGRSGSSYYSGLADQVGDRIDAVEVWNGNWTGDRYVRTAEELAMALDKPQTGGSDAHTVDRLLTCVTEIPRAVTGTADVVTALKHGLVRPVPPPEPPRGGGLRRLFGRGR